METAVLVGILTILSYILTYCLEVRLTVELAAGNNSQRLTLNVDFKSHFLITRKQPSLTSKFPASVAFQ